MKRHSTKRKNTNRGVFAAKPEELHYSSLPSKRRHFVKLGVFLGLLIPAFFVWSHYSIKQHTLHDLSVIGQDKPVLVQIHDIRCTDCHTLKSRVESVIDEYPNITYRIADIDTDKGEKFAKTHFVQMTSLVLLDKTGKRKNVSRGLISEDQIRAFLDQI